MAATLIHIKSKMLLPADPLAPPEEQMDPRDELVHRLLEHEKFKNAAQLLYQKQQVEANVWSNPDLSLYKGEEDEGEIVVSLVDLVKVFQQVLERRKEIPQIELEHETVTIAQMMSELRKKLNAGDEPVSLKAFFESCASRRAMIVAFFAVLEMVRLQAVVLVQTSCFRISDWRSTKCSTSCSLAKRPRQELKNNIYEPTRIDIGLRGDHLCVGRAGDA